MAYKISSSSAKAGDCRRRLGGLRERKGKTKMWGTEIIRWKAIDADGKVACVITGNANCTQEIASSKLKIKYPNWYMFLRLVRID